MLGFLASASASSPGLFRTLALVCCVLLLTGALCRRQRISDSRIRLELSPSTVTAGSIVRGRVWVQGQAVSVKGKAEVLGSPTYKLKWNDSCDCWVLVGQVPYGSRLRSGHYFLRVDVIFKDGSRGSAWTGIELE